MGVNSTNKIEFVLNLDALANKLAFDTNDVLSFNGGLYFTLFQSTNVGFITSFTELVSSTLITITNLTLNDSFITEDLPQEFSVIVYSLSGSMEWGPNGLVSTSISGIPITIQN